jgi:hypothetical protein
MRHITCTLLNQGGSQLLVLGSQIDNLILGLSFDYNLCFKYPNESCEPILDIYVSIIFQWYKELFNSMSFDPYNRPLKFKKSIETLIPQCVHSFFHTFLHSQEHEM